MSQDQMMRHPARPLRTLVVGAGVGGLSVAAALSRNGIDVQVVERAAVLRPAGAGLQLSPNAVRPLLDWGLSAGLAAVAVPIEAVETRSWRGAPVARTVLGRACEETFGAPYYAVRRSHLQDLLLGAVDPDGVHLGVTVDDVETGGDGGPAALTTRDGQQFEADLLVGADGVSSVVRAALVGDPACRSGLVALRGLVPMDRLPRSARLPLVRIWLGPGAHVVSYPVDAGETLSFTLTVRAERLPEAVGDARLDALTAARLVSDWHAPVPLLVGAATAVLRHPLVDRNPLSHLAFGRTVLTGDAAHPMLPFLAQGAAQALEDAAELGRHLGPVGPAGVLRALRDYSGARSGRTGHLQQAAREHGRVIHLPDGADQRRRDGALRAQSSLPARSWLYAGPQPVAVSA